MDIIKSWLQTTLILCDYCFNAVLKNKFKHSTINVQIVGTQPKKSVKLSSLEELSLFSINATQWFRHDTKLIDFMLGIVKSIKTHWITGLAHFSCVPFVCKVCTHTCQVLRFGRSHYGFLDKLKTTGVVGKYYGFMLVWRCNFVGNHLITFGLFLDEVMGLSQYR